jgi:hypothetical protein
MRLALNMAKMPTGRFSQAAIVEKQYVSKIPRVEVREAHMQGVEFGGHKQAIPATERHLGMLG